MSSEKLEKSTEDLICKNCQNHFQGLFCNQCGQKVINQRITIKHLFTIAFDSFNIHHGLLFTIKLMFTNPGKLINNYLQGRTKDFYNPLKYLLLIASINALLMIWFKVFDANVESTNEIIGLDDEASKFQMTIMTYVKKFLNFMAVISVPFYSLISKWIFKKWKLYYAEHLTINSYLFAQITLMQVLVILLIVLFPELAKSMFVFNAVIFIGYYTYALKGVFNIKILRSLLSSIVIYLLGMLMMMLFVIIVTFIVTIILSTIGTNVMEGMQ